MRKLTCLNSYRRLYQGKSRNIYHTAQGYYDLDSGRHFWYQRDRLGSTVAVYDDRGGMLQNTAYYPSGTPYQLLNSAIGTEVDSATDRLHIGNIWLSHSGMSLYDNTARLHDPILMHYGAPDPLYHKFPYNSPWSHCSGDPLNRVDKDGQEWKIHTTNEKGILVVHLTVTGVVVNKSNDKFIMKDVVNAINSQIKDVYTFSGEGYRVVMNSEFRAVTSAKEASSNDHVITIVNNDFFPSSKMGKILATTNHALGLQINVLASVTQATLDGLNKRTFAHEIGHTGGLFDVNLYNNLGVTNPGLNLMTQMAAIDKETIDFNDARKLEISQINEIINNYNSSLLDQFNFLDYILSITGIRSKVPTIIAKQ